LSSSPSIRRALTADVPAMGQIVNDAAEYGLMLHRSFSYLFEHVRDFVVKVDENDHVVGVCGLKVIWANLAEVYSLAVMPSQRGRGAGRALVEACVEEARQIGVRKLISLTYERTFFEKLGFEVVDRQKLPLKVWSECLRCAKNTACDEIAMIRVLEDVPDVAAPPLPQPDESEYVVPVQLGIAQPRRMKMDEAQ